MKNCFVSVLVASVFAAVVVAECPNACSAHGKCGAYDMCSCYRNWMSNDCSERVCQFGLAHVDTPKGDLDSSSGKLSDANTVVIANNAMYPYGTTEQYPFVGDIDGNVLTNSAHEYRECSNKGMCDRTTGTCACFEGYDGSACQRASCPTTNGMMCSGHGSCHTIEELANMDYNNIYELWDQDSTMGCKCDPGFSGADCSEKMCKYGADPLYFDSGSVARISNWTLQFYTAGAGTATAVVGNYSIIFYDAHGEDWQTAPIPISAPCTVVVAALEGIPNNVIPSNTVRCYKTNDISTKTATGTGPISAAVALDIQVVAEYQLAFPGNPGKLRQIEVTKYLDGTRPTLFSNEPSGSTLGWHIFPNGFSGEDVDMVNDLCEDVSVTLLVVSGVSVLDGISVQEAKALKRCLGTSDNNDVNNVEVYNWDYGTILNPHLIKLVDQTQYSSTLINGFENPNTYDINYDAALAQVPVTTLCHPSARNPTLYGYGAGDVTSSGAKCANKNAPGFFAVLYYDPNFNSGANPFRLITRPAGDYGITTLFSVYTTKGYLQMVNPHAAVYTRMLSYTASETRATAYTNVLHVTNTSSTPAASSSWYGWMDCETQSVGSNGNLACLNKNDYIMLLGLNSTDAVYPNMYQIKRLNRAEKSYANGEKLTDSTFFFGTPQQPQEGVINSDKIRSTITLDMSVNQDLLYRGASNVDALDTIARVYKFFADTSSPTGGYAYAGQCSHRGICNTDSGLCECFKGYTNDNCDRIDALAA